MVGTGSRLGRTAKALLMGSGAALLGALIHFSVLHFLQINAALVTILMGWLVGKAVRKGSGGRGGWRYQVMALLLTYLSIAMAYVPLLIGELRSARTQDPVATEQVAADSTNNDSAAQPAAAQQAEVAASPTEADAEEITEPAVAPAPLNGVGLIVVFLGMVVGLLFSLPVIIGMDSPLSLLIFGFGLFQAWQTNKRAVIDVTGPHALAEREPAPAPGA